MGAESRPRASVVRAGVLRSGEALACTALVMVACGCSDGPEVETTLVFDGERRTITTTDVSCTRSDDGVLIFVDGPGREMVRAVVVEQGHLVVERIALRHGEWRGFIADPREVEATKVDDVYRFRGRMPPNEGETASHLFQIEVTCPVIVDRTPVPGNELTMP